MLSNLENVCEDTDEWKWGIPDEEDGEKDGTVLSFVDFSRIHTAGDFKRALQEVATRGQGSLRLTATGKGYR